MTMDDIGSSLPPLIVGILFTLLGCAKIYGMVKRVYGGRGSHFAEKVVGQCPPDQCRAPVMNKILPFAFLGVGLFNLAWFLLRVMRFL